MGFNGKVVLFVEGQPTPRPRLPEPLDQIWREHLVKALDLVDIEKIKPISKPNIVRMDPTAQVSGVGPAIDEMIAAEIAKAEAAKSRVDAVVIAWDLQPAWYPEYEACRAEEIISFYRGLANSSALPEDPWRKFAERRFQLLSRRKEKRMKKTVPLRISRGAILAVCMEPTFESLLMVCEDMVRRTMGVHSPRVAGWPSWNLQASRPEQVLQLAIEAMRTVRPKTRTAKMIPGDMWTSKNTWGEFLLRKMIEDPDCLELLKRHPLSLRLNEILSNGK